MRAVPQGEGFPPEQVRAALMGSEGCRRLQTPAVLALPGSPLALARSASTLAHRGNVAERDERRGHGRGGGDARRRRRDGRTVRAAWRVPAARAIPAPPRAGGAAGGRGGGGAPPRRGVAPGGG